MGLWPSTRRSMFRSVSIPMISDQMLNHSPLSFLIYIIQPFRRQRICSDQHTNVFSFLSSCHWPLWDDVHGPCSQGLTLTLMPFILDQFLFVWLQLVSLGWPQLFTIWRVSTLRIPNTFNSENLTSQNKWQFQCLSMIFSTVSCLQK